MTIPLVNGVNPLQTTLLELGIVSGRVALLLRSAEIQPVFGRFVSPINHPVNHPSSLPKICSRAGGDEGEGTKVKMTLSAHQHQRRPLPNAN